MKDGLSTKQENKLPHSRKKVRRSPARPPNKKLEDVKMKNMKIINCTPHDVVIVVDVVIGDYISSDDTEVVPEFYVIEKSGIIPRLKEVQKKVDTIRTTATRKDEIPENGHDHGWNIHIDIMEKSFNNVEGLPEPKENTLYIVSALVAGACKNRDDLVVPNDTVRDDQGRIIGCRSLAKI